MEQWNLSDSMMNEEASVQIVFPLFQIQRFVRCRRQESLHHLVNKTIKSDDYLKQFEYQLMFDCRGIRLDPECLILEFGELDWIQLFVV